MISNLKKVDCFLRESIPTNQETILTDFDIKPENIVSLKVYFRSPQDCPFGRGNWIIDAVNIQNKVECIKLPKEMTEEQVLAFIKPLTDILDKRKNAKTN